MAVYNLHLISSLYLPQCFVVIFLLDVPWLLARIQYKLITWVFINKLNVPKIRRIWPQTYNKNEFCFILLEDVLYKYCDLLLRHVLWIFLCRWDEFSKNLLINLLDTGSSGNKGLSHLPPGCSKQINNMDNITCIKVKLSGIVCLFSLRNQFVPKAWLCLFTFTVECPCIKLWWLSKFFT